MLDFLRTLRFSSTAGLIINPVSQIWISKAVPFIDLNKMTGGSFNRVMARGASVANNLFKSITHHMIIGTFGCVAMLFFPAFTKHFDPDEGMMNVKTKFSTSFTAGWAYWPLVLFSTYNFVPSYLRQSMIDIYAFMYGIFSSYISNRSIHDF